MMPCAVLGREKEARVDVAEAEFRSDVSVSGG